FNFPQIT
nr:Chain C, TF/PR substrate peptide [Human immunodeficiency virus 1]